LRVGKLWRWIWCQGTKRCPSHGKKVIGAMFVCLFILCCTIMWPVGNYCFVRETRLALKRRSPWMEACKGWIYLLIDSLSGLCIFASGVAHSDFFIAKKGIWSNWPGHSPRAEACKGWIYLFIVSLTGLSILQVVWLIQIFVIAKKGFESIGLI
jgi:hypothetical protein